MDQNTKLKFSDFNTICRICLSKGFNMKTVFEPNLLEMLVTCTSIRIYNGDRLPESICSRCINQVTNAFELKKLCEKNDRILRTIVDELSPSDNESDDRTPFEDCESKEQDATSDHNEFKYVCDICKKEYDDYKVLKSHLRTHKLSKRHVCTTCGKTFYGASDLTIHTRIHTGEKPLECSICLRTFSDPRGLSSHMKTHTGVKPYKCDVCNKQFGHSFVLKTHMRTHTAERPYICSTCGKTFVYSHNLAIHARTHTGERPYSCLKCSKSFTSSSTLSAHMMTHTGVKRFVCSVCGKKVARSGDLATHMRTHTGEKPYPCTLCPKRYRMSCHLVAHMKSHTGEKNHICKLCEKRFSDARVLHSHMTTHTGEKPHACTVCGRSFSHYSALSNHRKTHKLREPNELLLSPGSGYVSRKLTMGVFSKIGDFLNRHRNKFVVGGVVVWGSVILTRYAQQKLKEWQQHEAKEFFERTRKQQHFESTERTCNQTIINLTNRLNESLLKAVNTDEILTELRNNPENKIELWERLKVLVFTKVSCVIYLSTLLTTILRVQMNIIGGYLYKDSLIISLDLQQKYLSICQELLNSGVYKLAKLFENEISKIVGVIPLKRQLKVDELENIFWTIQTAVRESVDDPVNNLRQFFVSESRNDTKGIYNNMIQETADLLDSDEVKMLMCSCISRGFVLLVDQISEFYSLNPTDSKTDFVHPSNVKIPLAKLIPIINGLVSKNSLPNTLTQQLINNDKLKTLGANVYEAFSYNNNNN
ncbi:hypothetical protein FQR65_LT02172 [Abscondita terminalis]|nr:hypothetical protein FQR65_LT02172 [Abscondita terminalis]